MDNKTAIKQDVYKSIENVLLKSRENISGPNLKAYPLILRNSFKIIDPIKDISDTIINFYTGGIKRKQSTLLSYTMLYNPDLFASKYDEIPLCLEKDIQINPIIELDFLCLNYNSKNRFEALFNHFSNKIHDKSDLEASIKFLIYCIDSRIEEISFEKQEVGLINPDKIPITIGLTRELHSINITLDSLNEMLLNPNEINKQETQSFLNYEEMALFFLLLKNEGIFDNNVSRTKEKFSKGIVNLTNDGKNSDLIKKHLGKLEKEQDINWKHFDKYFSTQWDNVNLNKIEKIALNLISSVETLKNKKENRG
ncbi:MAG: hypothetical protein ACOCWG_04835 [bacterium]